jgi:hypothetical protein
VLSSWRVLAALAFAGLGLPGPASAAPDHAEIAFVSGGSIWAARADGGERRLLVRPARPREALWEPAWSPDGSTLAYVSEVAPRGQEGTGAGGARLMLFDGMTSRPLTPRRKGIQDSSPAWSPDGSRLAFRRSILVRNGFRSKIVTRTLATGVERTLVGVGVGSRFSSVGEPAWSPDGSTIAYTHSRLDSEYAFRPLIRTLPAGGGDPRTLIRDAQSPAWSPDGRRLAFASIKDRNGRRCGSDQCWYAGELYTAAADGTGSRRLTTNEGDDARPTWSPDGSRLLFASDRNVPEGESDEIYSIAPDGSCLTWLTNGTPASETPAWRPGSGTRHDPGSCDPRSRPALIDTPPLPRMRHGLWLGPGFGGLLLSNTQLPGDSPYLSYADCARFDPARCPQSVILVNERACDTFTFRGISANAFRFRPRRGAILALSRAAQSVILFSGHAVTSIELQERNRLADIHRIVRGLRPLDSTEPVRRLAPPRVPPSLARRLELTARALKRHGSVERTARALGIRSFQLRGRLRLRRALLSFGRYRYSACS